MNARPTRWIRTLLARMLGLLLALVAFSGATGGDQAPAPAPAAAAAAKPQERVFKGDAGLIFSSVKKDKVADFESIIAKLKDALQKTSDPLKKQQAAGWKVYRASEPSADGNTLYVFVIQPAVPGADYALGRLVIEAFPESLGDLSTKYTASVNQQSLVDLTLVQDLTPP